MTRSAVRSRLAPPAFAGFASFGSASRFVAKAAAPELEERRRAKHEIRVPARLAKHNAGEVPHTSKFRPWRIKTYVAFTDAKQAIAFERYLKSGSGRAFAKKRL